MRKRRVCAVCVCACVIVYTTGLNSIDVSICNQYLCKYTLLGLILLIELAQHSQTHTLTQIRAQHDLRCISSVFKVVSTHIKIIKSLFAIGCHETYMYTSFPLWRQLSLCLCFSFIKRSFYVR